MNFRRIFLIKKYYSHETKFCFTVMNLSKRKCVYRIKPKLILNASTYNYDKTQDRFKQKAVENNRPCIGCKYYDYYNGECYKDDECNASQRAVCMTQYAATHIHMMQREGQHRDTNKRLRGSKDFNIEGCAQQAVTRGFTKRSHERTLK